LKRSKGEANAVRSTGEASIRNMGYTIEQTNRDVVTLRHVGISADWSQRYLLLADVHFDSPHSNRKLLRSLLTQAQETGAGVFVFGDWFDAMQGRADKRSDKSDLLPAYRAGDYVNRLVDDSADFLAPFASSIVFLADGNHETALRKYLEVDILLLLAGRLGVPKMGYSGFVRFLFNRGPDKRAAGATKRVMFFHHGAGGGGEVTQGIMRAQRQSAWVGDADIFVAGHIHSQWSTWMERLRLSNAGEVYRDSVLHLSLPTLKDEFTLSGGFHVERGRSPRPQGCYWLEFRHAAGEHGRVTFDVARG
jgi:predicted phosphodiesterase